MNLAAIVRFEKLDDSSVPDQSPAMSGIGAVLGGGIGVGEGTGAGLGEGEGEGGPGREGPPRLQPQLRLRHALRSSVSVSRAHFMAKMAHRKQSTGRMTWLAAPAGTSEGATRARLVGRRALSLWLPLKKLRSDSAAK